MQHSVKMATMRKSEWKKNVWKCFMVTLKGSYYFFLLFWALWVFAISRAAGEKTACSREPRVRIQHAAEDSACFFTRRSGRWAAGARQHQEAKLHTRNKNTLSTVTVTLTLRERNNFRRHKHGDVFICSFIFRDDFTVPSLCCYKIVQHDVIEPDLSPHEITNCRMVTHLQDIYFLLLVMVTSF